MCVSHQTSQHHVELHLTENQINKSMASIKQIFLSTLNASKEASQAEDEEEEEKEEDEEENWDPRTQEDKQNDVAHASLVTPDRETGRKPGRSKVHENSTWASSFCGTDFLLGGTNKINPHIVLAFICEVFV